jgi:Uncharacterised protein family, YAP/Alf4/glomulin
LSPFIGQKVTRDNALKVLDIVIIKGNAKEVFLKCIEALRLVHWERTFDDDDDDDDGEATMTEKLAEITKDEKENKVDPIAQTVELYRAINKGDLL